MAVDKSGQPCTTQICFDSQPTRQEGCPLLSKVTVGDRLWKKPPLRLLFARNWLPHSLVVKLKNMLQSVKR